MASVRLFFLLATLAVAAATAPASYDGDKQEPYPEPKNEAKPEPKQPYSPSTSCDGCTDAKKRVLEARGKCCQEVSKHVECLCPTMNALISAGVPLKEVCYDDMECKKIPYVNTGSVLIDPSKECSVTDVCNAVVDALINLNKCFSVQPGENRSGGSCFAEALPEFGFKNPAKVIEKLFRP